MTEPPSVLWNFGKLESVLATVHDVADSKRTAFQSRLKNLHRLKFPQSMVIQKGRPARYAAGDIMMMALALELTQLGLTPEAVVQMLTANWSNTVAALRVSAKAVIETPAHLVSVHATPAGIPLPQPVFLYFDPATLSPLTEDLNHSGTYMRANETFHFDGADVVVANLARWTSSDVNRLSLINLTSLMRRIADASSNAGHGVMSEPSRIFFLDIVNWATADGRGTNELAQDGSSPMGVPITKPTRAPRRKKYPRRRSRPSIHDRLITTGAEATEQERNDDVDPKA